MYFLVQNRKFRIDFLYHNQTTNTWGKSALGPGVHLDRVTTYCTIYEKIGETWHGLITAYTTKNPADDFNKVLGKKQSLAAALYYLGNSNAIGVRINEMAWYTFFKETNVSHSYNNPNEANKIISVSLKDYDDEPLGYAEEEEEEEEDNSEEIIYRAVVCANDWFKNAKRKFLAFFV